jgi:hypothetical protein
MDDRMFKLARITGASFLAFLGACAGHYDVGDTNDGGAGAPEGGTGGSSVSTGGSSTGGSSVDGGTGGSSIDGGTGGRGSGGSSVDGGTAGSAGSGGSSMAGSPPMGGTGGTGMDPSRCGQPFEFIYGTPEPPAIVWARMQAVLHDIVPAAYPSGLPEETTPAWAESRMASELAAARLLENAPRGARRFMDAWLAVGEDEDAGETAENAALAFVSEGVTFASLTLPEGARTLFEDPALNRLRHRISERGTWMLSSLFCLDVGTPPESPPLESSPGMTRRESLSELVSGAACLGCHRLIDPMGFSLEGIDPETGEPRETDNGLPIDTAGSFDATSSSFTFSSIVDLAPQLAQSCEVASCFVSKVTNDAAAEAGLGTFTAEELAAITYAYVEAGHSFEALLRAMVRTPTFLE